MILLSLQGVQKSFGTNEVLRDASLVLQDGQVIGAGTHDVLMEECDEYRTIAQTQMGAGKEAV